jgi:hypothetical protein
MTSNNLLPSIDPIDTSNINYKINTSDDLNYNIHNNIGDMSSDLKKATHNQTMTNTINNYENINVKTSSTNMLSSFGTINPNVVSDIISDVNTNEHIIKNDFMNMMGQIEENKQCDVTKHCSVETCGSEDLYPVLEPTFNMREASKQCILLEDHLNNLKKRCNDCIRKHFLTVDGFLEESISLEKDIKQRKYYRELHREWVKIEKLYAQNPLDSDNLDNVSQKIRYFRKPLVAEYFDTVSEYNL